MRIECQDNLEFMKSIEENSIDIIYCDILYGTGRKFSDYQDLKPIKSDIEEHYIPRLKEMYRILKDTGTIYLQIDTKINHWIRCIMDDIFGYDNKSLDDFDEDSDLEDLKELEQMEIESQKKRLEEKSKQTDLSNPIETQCHKKKYITVLLFIKQIPN
jgi:DNA modification methylase